MTSGVCITNTQNTVSQNVYWPGESEAGLPNICLNNQLAFVCVNAMGNTYINTVKCILLCKRKLVGNTLNEKLHNQMIYIAYSSTDHYLKYIYICS